MHDKDLNQGPHKRVSKRQVVANRKNGKLGGPKSDDGKDKVRWNALKHGLLSKSVVLNVNGFDEREEEFNFLLTQLREDLAPVGILEEMQVEKIAVTYWRLRRVLRAEGGLIGQSMIAMNDRTVDKEERIEMLSKLSGSQIPLEKSLRRNVGGVIRVIDLLSIAIASVSEKGIISKALQSLLRQMFGGSEGGLTHQLLVLNAFVNKHESAKDVDQEEFKKYPSKEKCKQMMLDLLNEAMDEYRSSLSRVEEFEHMENEVRVSSLCVPTGDASLKTLRYETTLEKQLNRAMNQLERLQRGRAGECVPPPLSVDFKLDA